MENIEILAPVGSYPALIAAIDAKTDSIYFGVEKLNMRSHTSNFSLSDISKISKYAKEKKVKTYLTLNSIIYDKDIFLMQKILNTAKKAKIDAIIASDISTILYAKKIGLNIHISTQANICNIETLKFYSKFADAVVLARELDLLQIKTIAKNIKKEKILSPNKKPIKLEVFIHGALCVAISGKCYMSLFQYNSSANRGKCLQACRRKYIVEEEETGKKLLIDNNHIMSLKDLCTLPFLDKILKSGVSILKIEGRARSAEYVKTTVSVYKDAIKSIKEKTFSKEKIKDYIDQLKTVYNRGFSNGYYFRKTFNEFTSSYGSEATYTKKYIGKVTNYFSKIKIAEILAYAGNLKKNDNILIIGNKTGVLNHKIKNIKNHPKKKITLPINTKLRKNDEIYLMQKSFK